MSYNDKVAMLIDAVRPYVTFTDAAQATVFATRHDDASVHTELTDMAQKLFESCGTHTTDTAKILERICGSSVLSKYSALREAIRGCAERYLAENRTVGVM
jgi:hypothetical protein